MLEEQISEFANWWQDDGTVQSQAPAWAQVRAVARQAFPSPYTSTSEDSLAQLVGLSIQLLDRLKPMPPGRAFLGDDPSLPDYSRATQAVLPDKLQMLEGVITEAVNLFQGLPQWNHPLTMPNVIPPANLAAIVAAMLTEVFSPNLIEGEYSWNVEFSELESAAMVAKLIGWDAKAAGGLYTFGGTGCYLYGLKYALTRVLGAQSRQRGIRTDGKLLVSQQGHYCKLNTTDWTGLGMDNIIEIETDPITNAMSVEHLEWVMGKLYDQNIPVISVVCTMGTTDAFAVDPVAHVRQLIDRYPNPPGYGKAFLYCDAVVGWSWLTFANYDFQVNPLGFSPSVLSAIAVNYTAIKDMVYADGIGCDFHKVGWAPYNCSLFMMRNYKEFQNLMTRPGSDYLQERTSYNPGLYTLEVSRSASYSMAGWATLKFLGYEGLQAILGGILEIQAFLRQSLLQESTAVCVNAEDNGFVTLFRIYPSGVDAKAQYQRELTDRTARHELIAHNQLQEAIANKLWNWFRDGQLHYGEYAPYTSYSTGFRPTEYNADESDPNAMVYALKAFPMNLNITPASMKTLLRMALAARTEIEAEQGCS